MRLLRKALHAWRAGRPAGRCRRPAPDGHAKNFSIRLHAGGRYALTPLYDVLSAWPIIGTGDGELLAKVEGAIEGTRAHARRLHEQSAV